MLHSNFKECFISLFPQERLMIMDSYFKKTHSEVENPSKYLTLLKIAKRSGLLIVGILPLLWILVLFEAACFAGPYLFYFVVVAFSGPERLHFGMAQQLFPIVLVMSGFVFFILYASKKFTRLCWKFIKKNW